MENAGSSLSATEIAVGSLLAGGGRGGYSGGGGGAWGGGYGGHAPFAGPGSNAVRLDRNAQQIEDQADCTRAVFGAGLDSVNGNFENLVRANDFNAIRDGQFRAEIRTNDRLLALQAEMNANARAADKCCCEVKLRACEDKAELKAEILAVESRTIARELDTANRLILELKLENRHNGGH